MRSWSCLASSWPGAGSTIDPACRAGRQEHIEQSGCEAGPGSGADPRRDVKRAEDELRALATQYPGNADVETQVGILAAGKGDLAGASKSLAKALSLDENNLERSARSSRSTCHRKMSLRLFRVRKVGSPEPRTMPIPWCWRRGRIPLPGIRKKREALLRKTIEVDRSNFQAYSMLGRLYVTQRRLGEALVEFDELAKRQPFVEDTTGHSLQANKPHEGGGRGLGRSDWKGRRARPRRRPMRRTAENRRRRLELGWTRGRTRDDRDSETAGSTTKKDCGIGVGVPESVEGS